MFFFYRQQEFPFKMWACEVLAYDPEFDLNFKIARRRLARVFAKKEPVGIKRTKGLEADNEGRLRQFALGLLVLFKTTPVASFTTARSKLSAYLGCP